MMILAFGLTSFVKSLINDHDDLSVNMFPVQAILPWMFNLYLSQNNITILCDLFICSIINIILLTPISHLYISILHHHLYIFQMFSFYSIII